MFLLTLVPRYVFVNAAKIILIPWRGGRGWGEIDKTDGIRTRTDIHLTTFSYLPGVLSSV